MQVYVTRVLIASLILAFACTSNSNEEDKNVIPPPWERAFYGKPDFCGMDIEISARFSECGEWGGHTETLLVSRINRFENRVIYERYFTKCEEKKDTFPYMELVQLDTFLIPRTQCALIGNYAKRLLEHTLDAAFPGHSGHYFNLKSTGSSGFDIGLYTGTYEPVESYQLLLEDLGLSTDHLTLESVYGMDLD